MDAKIRLQFLDGRQSELQCVQLPHCSVASLSEFLSFTQNVFKHQLRGCSLKPQFTYVDDNGSLVAVGSDREMQEAMKSSIRTYTFTMADSISEDGWELVETDVSAMKVCAQPTWTTHIRFWLNGKEQVLENPAPSLLLADWLREKKSLTGTKIGCGEGGCGICTVAMTFEAPSGNLKTISINSCLRRVCALDGVHIVTTEGIGGQAAGYHPVQKAIADGNGSQCGYCTPGWVMNMFALLQRKGTQLSREDVEQNFDGNLCRCTGYRPILNAFGEFADGGKLCSHRQSFAHPAELLGGSCEPLHFSDPATGDEWYRPLTLEQLAHLRSTSTKKVRLLCGNTSAGVTKYYSSGNMNVEFGTVFIDITRIPELTGSNFDASTGITFGANVSIAEVITSLEAYKAQAPHFNFIAEHMKRVASVQIRNVGSWTGNLMLAREHPTFASDLTLVLSTAGASISILDSQGTSKDVSVIELLALHGEVTVLSMKIPMVSSACIFRTYKTAQRHVFAHAIVNLGTLFAFDGHRRVTKAQIVVGGATETLLMAVKTAACLSGRRLDQAAFFDAAKSLAEEIGENPSTNLRQSSAFRLDLAYGFLYKAFLAACDALPSQLQSTQILICPADSRPVSSGVESYGVDPSESPIGQFIPKLKSRKQASGEAMYTSDAGRGCLVGQIVFSTVAKAKLVTLDPKAALKMPGVVEFVSAADVPGINCVDPADGKEQLVEKAFFEVGDTIPCVGCVLGLIVADNWVNARQAAKAVVQRYNSNQGVVTSLTDAEILGRAPTHESVKNAFACDPALRRQKRLPEFQCPFTSTWATQDTLPLAAATQSLKGTTRMGWQYHFYMETQSVLVTPIDGDCYEVLAGTQFQANSQQNIAAILKVPQHKVNVKTYQVGGAFGGKILRNNIIQQACAVAAHKLKAPIFAQNERSDDMQMMTGRELANYRYTVTFEPTGKVDTMDATMLWGPGYYFGDTASDSPMGIQWADDCYFYRKFKVGTSVVLTDVSHTTSCRSPGAMNAGVFAQLVMEHIAKTIGKSTEEVQEINFYKAGDKTPFGVEIGKEGFNFTVPVMWKKLQADTRYADRKAAVTEYNSKNRWTKKGIALSPVKYLADMYGSQYVHALVDVYPDASVLISHAGIEIGQGINTKAVLVAASTLGIPIDMIRVGPADTSKSPNCTATGGSGTSESVCAAVIKVCEALKDRLKPYSVGKALSWANAVQAAIQDNVPLMVSSWNIWEKTGANATPYATYGVAAAEVLVDILTGEILVERVDILMDLGTQLDAATDLGQLQGGFVMAMGWMLTEQLRWNATGTQLNLGTWEYKIPTAYDIPVQFNVSLLKDVPNQSPTAVKGSKLQSEPVMTLVASVMLAVKEALYAARKDNGLGDDWFELDMPLTPENVRTQSGTSVDKFIIPQSAAKYTQT